ncbi:hypothetical protein V1T75_10520 [Tenacibaculum sp. FZY0031]|uniref:hypothetical protein n=1 Tax=Tenacibaculum sp. FZY0031 TaxID=3116648 RepID=UPI002ECEB083|nr:hypothetical protein [Tenacibaculum sp. FZY0031]
MIRINAQIEKFTQNAQRDYYEGGSAQNFHAVRLNISKPKKLLGYKFTVLIESGKEFDEKWRKENSLLSFEIEPLLLEDHNFLFFEAALENIKWEK